MFKKLKQPKEGFTIIEVLIVLAIAALILLIVFLAVPALQRNSRNTQRKNDVASILAAISDYQTNNNGVMPNAAGTTYAAGAITFGCTGAGCPASQTTSQARVGYFQGGIGGGQGQVTIGTALIAARWTLPADDRVYINTTATCAAAAGTTSAGAQREVAAVYEIENASNSYQGICQAS